MKETPEIPVIQLGEGGGGKKTQAEAKPSNSRSETDGASEGWDETAGVAKHENVLSAGDSVDRSQAGDNSQSR